MNEPQRLAEILPNAIQDIRRRMELRRQPLQYMDCHKRGVLAAIKAYHERHTTAKGRTKTKACRAQKVANTKKDRHTGKGGQKSGNPCPAQRARPKRTFTRPPFGKKKVKL